MFTRRQRLKVRVRNCPLKKDVLEDRYFMIEVPNASSIAVEKLKVSKTKTEQGEDEFSPRKVVAHTSKSVKRKRQAMYDFETISTSIYVSLYEREIWTRQAFKSRKDEGCIDGDSAIFFQGLKKATMDINADQVEFMCRALTNAVKKPQFSTKFQLHYALQLSVVSVYDDWEWVVDYDASHLTTRKGKDLTIAAVEIDKCILSCQDVIVSKESKDASMMAMPTKVETDRGKNKFQLLHEIQKLIERQNDIEDECEQIAEAASELKLNTHRRKFSL